MKLSRMIKVLQKSLEKDGDIEVEVPEYHGALGSACYGKYDYRGRTINVQIYKHAGVLVIDQKEPR